MQVAGLEFGTKTALGAHVRAIRARYRDGEAIPVGSRDHAFMMDLISRHPDFPEKFNGLKGFVVDSDERGGRCFYCVDALGRLVPFSFDICVAGKGRSEDQEARAAARLTVVTQILDFRDNALWNNPECGICRAPVGARTSHVDHQAPKTFVRLSQAFKEANGSLDLAVVGIHPPGSRQFRDPAAGQAWSDFHREHAQLRLLCIACNLGPARRAEGEAA